MNQDRRQFIKGIGLFSILAGSGRVWKVNREVILPNPDYVFASYEMAFYTVGQTFRFNHTAQQPTDLPYLIPNYGTAFTKVVLV